MFLVIPCAFLNKRTERIILINHSPRQMAALNLKPKAEKFEEKVTAETIIERIIKVLLKNKIFVVLN